jgi:hypothetical protein
MQILMISSKQVPKYHRKQASKCQSVTASKQVPKCLRSKQASANRKQASAAITASKQELTEDF